MNTGVTILLGRKAKLDLPSSKLEIHSEFNETYNGAEVEIVFHSFHNSAWGVIVQQPHPNAGVMVFVGSDRLRFEV